MHCRTYDRLRRRYDVAEAQSMVGMAQLLNRLDFNADADIGGEGLYSNFAR
jgi:hypothetical protein